jgi:hypothetical protein
VRLSRPARSNEPSLAAMSRPGVLGDVFHVLVDVAAILGRLPRVLDDVSHVLDDVSPVLDDVFSVLGGLSPVLGDDFLVLGAFSAGRGQRPFCRGRLYGGRMSPAAQAMIDHNLRRGLGKSKAVQSRPRGVSYAVIHVLPRPALHGARDPRPMTGGWSYEREDASFRARPRVP